MKTTRFSVFLSFTLLLVPATSYAASFSEALRIISGERDNNVHYAEGSRLAKDANCSNGSAGMLASISLPRIVQGNYKNLVLDPNIPHPIFRDGKETGALFNGVAAYWLLEAIALPLPTTASDFIELFGIVRKKLA